MARRKRPSSGRPPASTPGTSPAMGKWSPPMVRAAVLGRRPQQRVCMPRGAQPGPACDNVAGARQPVAATPSKQRGLTERTSAFRSGEEASGSPVRSPAISRAHARTLVPSTGASSATGSAPGSGTGVPNSAHPRAPTERATSATLQSPLPADPAPLPSRPRPIGPAQKSHKARDFRTAPWRTRNPPPSDPRCGRKTPLPRTTASYGVTSATSPAGRQSTSSPAFLSPRAITSAIPAVDPVRLAKATSTRRGLTTFSRWRFADRRPPDRHSGGPSGPRCRVRPVPGPVRLGTGQPVPAERRRPRVERRSPPGSAGRAGCLASPRRVAGRGHRPAGPSTRPGLRMSCGSSARLIERITSTAASPRCRTSQSRRAAPIPCSPVTVPPSASAAS
jgi:hypothetical protein